MGEDEDKGKGGREKRLFVVLARVLMVTCVPC